MDTYKIGGDRAWPCPTNGPAHEIGPDGAYTPETVERIVKRRENLKR